jgi:hypothetical protein
MLILKPEKYRSEAYRISQRVLKCDAHFLDGCGGDVASCHLSKQTDAAKATKASDFFTTPFCHTHHSLQHQKGEPWFYHKLYAEDTFYLFESHKSRQVLNAAFYWMDKGKPDEAWTVLEMARRLMRI